MLSTMKGLGVSSGVAARLARRQKMPSVGMSYSSSACRLENDKDSSGTGEAKPKELIYEGRYWKSLRRIRRVSLGSCSTGLVIVVSGGV
jgi:hypothetical protein